MRNRRALIIVFSSLLIISIGTAIYAKNISWKKIMDRPVSQFRISDETLLEFDSLVSERQKGIVFDQSSSIINSGTINQTSKEKIKLDIQGTPIQLSVDDEGNVLSVFDPEIHPVYITQSGDKKIISFNVNNDLYIMNVSTLEPEKVSYDKVDGFDKKELILHVNAQVVKNTGDHISPLSWINASLMNNTASQIIFESNRRGFIENQPHVDIWGKDLETGNEKILLKDALIHGWIDDITFAYKRSDHTAGTYNTNNGEIKEASTSTGFYGVTSSVVIEATTNSIIVTDLISKKNHEIDIKDSISVFNGTVSLDEKYTAAFFCEKNDQSPRIVIIDLQTLEINRIINPPAVGLLLFDHNNKLIVWSYEKETTWVEE